MHSATSRRLPRLGLLLGVLLVAASESQAASRALLIGINDYVAVPDLRGAVNDVEFLREVLVSRFGFLPQDIEAVTDLQASRAGILAALDRLAARSKEGDLIYIHYSGHGSQRTDQDGDEEDKQDETIISQDGRTPGVADITDDEIGDKLHAIRAKTLIVVLDSCHAGTATRSLGALSDANALLGDLRPRNVPADTRDALYRSLRGGAGGAQARSVVPLVSAGHVLFTGAAYNEEALDGPIDHKPHGLFSYALGKSLSRSAPTATAREVFAGVEQEFERIRGQLNLNKMPDPQLEAESADLDRPLLTRPAPPSRLPPLPRQRGLRRASRRGSRGSTSSRSARARCDSSGGRRSAQGAARCGRSTRRESCAFRPVKHSPRRRSRRSRAPTRSRS